MCVHTNTDIFPLWAHEKAKAKKFPHTEHYSEKDRTSSNRFAFSCKKKKKKKKPKPNKSMPKTCLIAYLLTHL